MYEYWQQQAHFRSNGQIGAPTGKLLISLLNEHNPHCYIHSTQYFRFLFHYVTNSTILCCKSLTLNNKKKVGGGGGGGGWIITYNPTKNPIKLEENRRSPNAYTFYKKNSNRYSGLQPGVNYQILSGEISKKTWNWELWFVYVTCQLLNIVYNPSKYHKYIWNGVGVFTITRLVLPNTARGDNLINV